MPFPLFKLAHVIRIVSVALLFSVANANAARSGDAVYNSYCIACHMNGVAGAPKFGHPEDWQPRVDKGMDVLLKDAMSGLRAMPPKGLCFDCTEDELRSAIQYMIDNSEK